MFAQEWLCNTPGMNSPAVGKPFTLAAIIQDGTTGFSLGTAAVEQYKIGSRSFMLYHGSDYAPYSQIAIAPAVSPYFSYPTVIWIDQPSGEKRVFQTFVLTEDKYTLHLCAPLSVPSVNHVAPDIYRIHYSQPIGTLVALNDAVPVTFEDVGTGITTAGTVTEVYSALVQTGSLFDVDHYGTVSWFKDRRKLVPHDATALFDNRCSYSVASYDPAKDDGHYLLSFISARTGKTITQNFDVWNELPTGKLMNISVRGECGTGDDVLIGGVVVTKGKATILVRALGAETLAKLGVTGALDDPLIEAHSGPAIIAQNDNWSSSAQAAVLPDTFKAVGASSLPGGSRDAVLLMHVDAGAYTFLVRGADGGIGVTLLEIYLVPQSGDIGELANLSARAHVDTGNKVLIAGFVTQGNTRVLVRGTGPTLTASGLDSNKVLLTPELELRDASGALLETHTAWSTEYDFLQMTGLFNSLGATPYFQLTKDSVSYSSASGIRTVIIKGANNTTGIALAEVYLAY